MRLNTMKCSRVNQNIKNPKLRWTSFMYRKIEFIKIQWWHLIFQWWHLISFSGICRYLFWTSFYTTLFFPINREIYLNEISMLQIPKIWIRKKMWQLSEFNAGWCMLQKWHQSTTDKNYSFSPLSASDQYIPHA